MRSWIRDCAGPLSILLLCAFDSFGAEEGGAWTNLAGHVLKATPQTIQGQTVSFVQDGTEKTVDHPLSVFPPSEQERLRSRLQETTIPEGLQSAYEFSARILKRARLLRENGQTSEEDYRKTVESTLSALRRQAVPLVEQKKLSPERLDLILRELAPAEQ
ncbi:MAG: hypothetical protein EOM72_01110 [Opitutae bacterium]|nr:hypothetical protein [Opitutae bacterium]